MKLKQCMTSAILDVHITRAVGPSLMCERGQSRRSRAPISLPLIRHPSCSQAALDYGAARRDPIESAEDEGLFFPARPPRNQCDCAPSISSKCCFSNFIIRFNDKPEVFQI